MKPTILIKSIFPKLPKMFTKKIGLVFMTNGRGCLWKVLGVPKMTKNLLYCILSDNFFECLPKNCWKSAKGAVFEIFWNLSKPQSWGSCSLLEQKKFVSGPLFWLWASLQHSWSVERVQNNLRVLYWYINFPLCNDMRDVFHFLLKEFILTWSYSIVVVSRVKSHV